MRLLPKKDSALHNSWFYSYKLRGVCTLSGIFYSVDITKANVHDTHYLQEIKHQLSECVLLGDKGYLSTEQQLDLFESANIVLEIPMGMNQKGYKKQPYIFRKSRKRIETFFLSTMRPVHDQEKLCKNL